VSGGTSFGQSRLYTGDDILETALKLQAFGRETNGASSDAIHHRHLF